MAKITIADIPYNPKSDKKIKPNRFIKPVDKEDANAEIERGEVAMGPFSFDGIPETYIAAGKKHSKGGTPVSLPENSFIFSDHSSMKITDPDVQEDFGKTVKKRGYTPADIAKQYDINIFKNILLDKDSDTMQKKTAKRMVEDYNRKLGKLSLVQESQKGFENGIPFVATPYLTSMGIDPAQFVGNTSKQQDTVSTSSEQFQMGGGPQQSFVMNEDFLNKFKTMLGSGDISGSLSPFMAESRGQVPNKQAERKTGSYGRADWTDAQHFPDFRNRNAWYFKEHPDFNPRDTKQVKSFQKAYNDKAAAMGLDPYFSNKPGSKYSTDGKFGEVTFSVPNLEFKSPQQPSPEPATEVPALRKEAPPIEKGKDIIPAPRDTNNPFWTQDLVRMAGAAGDFARLHKYLPWNAGYQTMTASPTYYDPSRELAANSEQSHIAAGALSTYAGPQELNSRLSEVNGRSLENAANILGKYNDLNVGVANQFSEYNTNLLNQDSLHRADRTTNLYDKTVAANESFDNARTKARENMREAFINGWTNRGKTQALNEMSPYFKTDPVTGFVTKKDRAVTLNPAAAQSNQLMDFYDTMMQNPNLRNNPSHVEALLKLFAKQ